ncbi:hypothetical protein [Erythrobacter sp. THAF29]|uniref:hypothetical protein n=1 Tax=Erythrobacter sp. THAF29 TaxID=2587851 RepID=UPI001269656D|nr:hypothetical protein [Erythrobacter sp. THAF29]QFT78154.1 hypothetical protein FIU90_11450 [Erythrobacter sp. THAF29]
MIKRRIIAAGLLLAFATGAPLFWNGGEWDSLYFGVNLILAALGFLFLHYKWKRTEKPTVTPDKARDIFS